VRFEYLGAPPPTASCPDQRDQREQRSEFEQPAAESVGALPDRITLECPRRSNPHEPVALGAFEDETYVVEESCDSRQHEEREVKLVPEIERHHTNVDDEHDRRKDNDKPIVRGRNASMFSRRGSMRGTIARSATSPAVIAGKS